jgi:DNA (cytosine-5)-methyltransferase 1
VPPLLGRAVGQEIIKALKIAPSKPRKTLKCGEPALLNFDMSDATRYFNVPLHTIAQRVRQTDIVGAVAEV